MTMEFCGKRLLSVILPIMVIFVVVANLSEIRADACGTGYYCMQSVRVDVGIGCVKNPDDGRCYTKWDLATANCNDQISCRYTETTSQECADNGSFNCGFVLINKAGGCCSGGGPTPTPTPAPTVPPGCGTCNENASPNNCSNTCSGTACGRCSNGGTDCAWGSKNCGATPPPPPQCSSAPLVMIDKSDGAGFKWYGASVQIPYTTNVCYKSDPSGVNYTSRQTQDGTEYKGAVNVNGTACFTVTLGNSWTTGGIEAFRNECSGSTNGTCEQLYSSESCRNFTDIMPTTPTPSCSISMPISTTVQIGTPVTVTADTTASNGTIQEVRFSSGSTAIFTTSSPDTSSPYQTTITGVSAGTRFLTAQGIMAGVETCTKQMIVNVLLPLTSWWQVSGGVSSMGSITSLLPAGELLDISTTPGVAVSGGNSIDVGSGNISSTNWKVESSTALASTLWADNGYTAIKNRILSSLDPKELTFGMSTSDITTGTLVNGAYYFIKSTGDLDVNSLTVGDNKVVIIANENVNIKSNISLNDNAGFLMILAGGNINVDPTVTSLEGLFVAEGNFNTGSNTTQQPLRVEGTVAVGGTVNFQRNIPGATPGELFVFRPDLVALMPKDVMRRNNTWEEVAP